MQTRKKQTRDHTRLPAYLQQKPGIVRECLGAFPFPDQNAVDPNRADAVNLYTVEFSARDVWDSSGTGTILADLFEPYLEPQS
ncbi:MAG TPA: SH3-like domain-containing protein [Candidatus Baltobacteraceae bacterium]|nr:SH3-like domain-containing protein [Candidatus Baltobacteraceae bacterium]